MRIGQRQRFSRSVFEPVHGACSAASTIGMGTGDALVSLGASETSAVSGKPSGFATLCTASRSRSGAGVGSKSPRLIASIKAGAAHVRFDRERTKQTQCDVAQF